MELSKKKQPPRNIWHNETMLNKWFEDVFDEKEHVDYMEFNPSEVQ